MAEQGTGDELDLSVEEKSGSKKKLIIIIAAALLVLIGGGAAATLFLASDDGDSAASAEGGADGNAAQGQEAAGKPVIYHPLDPAFVVSLEGRPRTLQVSMQVMTRDDALVEFLQHNDPLVRDRILSLLMDQDGNKLKTRAGKKALQSKLQKEIRKIAQKQGVRGEVEALYFTSFVMQ